jgi:hypothetical protein
VNCAVRSGTSEQKILQKLGEKLHFTLSYPFKGAGVQIPAIFQDVFLFLFTAHKLFGDCMVALTPALIS